MTMAAPTGKTRDTVCGECGADLTEVEQVILKVGKPRPFWTKPHHRAACGLQCIVGGLRGDGDMSIRQVIDSGHFHGTRGERVGQCPCKRAA